MCVNRPHRYPGHRQTPEEGMKHRKCWSKSIGERGARVRLYEDRPGGPLSRSVYVNGKEKRKSLGHRDKELAIRQAYELLHSLLSTSRRSTRRRSPSAWRSSSTWKALST